MIKNKENLRYFLEEDKKALNYRDKKRPRIFSDEIWRFEIALRKTEYYLNVYGDHSIPYIMSKLYFKHISLKLGFSIGLNVFGPGLSIAHYGTIIVNGKAKVGSNCRIHADTLIGARGGYQDTLLLGITVI